MIPLLHDFTGATVLVFGGGTVGARKARRFASEADVVVVSGSGTLPTPRRPVSGSNAPTRRSWWRRPTTPT
jgi:hypothetical protein